MRKVTLFFIAFLGLFYIPSEAAYVISIQSLTLEGAVADTVIFYAVDASGDTAFRDTTAFATSGYAYLSGLEVDTVYTISASKLGYTFQPFKVKLGAAFTDTVFTTAYVVGSQLLVFARHGYTSALNQTQVGSVICSLRTSGDAYLMSDTTDADGLVTFDYTLAASTKYKMVLAKSGYPQYNRYFETETNGRFNAASIYRTSIALDMDTIFIYVQGGNSEGGFGPLENVSCAFTLTGPAVIDSVRLGTTTVSDNTDANGYAELVVPKTCFGTLTIGGVQYEPFYVGASKTIGAIIYK